MDYFEDEAHLWVQPEKVIMSIYWSDEAAAWRYTVTRQRQGEWARWEANEAPTFRQATSRLAASVTALGLEYQDWSG